MAAVDRADYMDNIKVAEIEQTIQKEKAIQREYFKDQEATGKLKLRPPTPPVPKKSLAEVYGLPEHFEKLQDDPDAVMQLSISRSMWGSCNPGYYVRDGPKVTSTMKEHFIWDEEEIEFMKQQRILDKTFNRRRDEFTNYVEKRAQYAQMTKAPK